MQVTFKNLLPQIEPFQRSLPGPVVADVSQEQQLMVFCRELKERLDCPNWIVEKCVHFGNER